MKSNKKKLVIVVVSLVTIVLLASWFYFSLPINRVGLRSELIMLGDLNNDKTWDKKDKTQLQSIIENPFRANRLKLFKVDVNKNQVIDQEDITILNDLYQYKDPYLAEELAIKNGDYFVRPRELFRYLPTYEYIQPPLVTIGSGPDTVSSFNFPDNESVGFNFNYKDQLLLEVRNEEKRFNLAYQLRKNSLTDIEIESINMVITQCNGLYREGNYFELLLQLIDLVEITETLNTKEQQFFVHQLPVFRNHLRELLRSELFVPLETDSISHKLIFEQIEKDLQNDLGISLKIDSLPPPRDFYKIENYIDRAEWQKNKSKSKKEDFIQLLLYAQYDRRYLRAVSKTSRKNHDLKLDNHNLPMLLLFREALRIKNGDKKAAIGLLDEAFRIPFSWVKSIPPKMLPSSIAIENFLLPGNKEDGLDKSRHWNVFGGVALYKTPEEALILSLQREVQDVKRNNYSYESMREFTRDLLANTNGIYHVVSVNPKLIYNYEE